MTELTRGIDLHSGDCLDVLATLPADHFDSCVCDPPYGLEFMGKEWDGTDGFRRSLNKADVGRDNVFGRSSARGPEYRTVGAGKMSKPGIGERDTKWVSNQGWNQFRCETCGHLLHGGSPCQCAESKPVRADNRWNLFQQFNETWAREVYRVLKPGAHLVAFGGTRTYHRLACAIEDAGFEIRDQVAWVYGQGFPKSLDVSKAIDKAAGARGHDGCQFNTVGNDAPSNGGSKFRSDHPDYVKPQGITDAAKQWDGWGTALKPSIEDLIIAQKAFNDRHYIDTIGSTLLRLWSRLWLMLSAKDAAELSTLSPRVYGVDPHAFAQWNAESISNIRAGLSAQMDMSRFELALISSLSTVSSWAATWAESWTPENTFTTKTELETTTDLRTLSYLASRITADCIIPAHKSGRWSIAYASNAARAFNAVVLKLQGILELSVLAPAFAKAAGNSLDAGASPNLDPICLARKPLSEGTVAANVLRWGTGAINVDGCRVATDEALGGGDQSSNTKVKPEGWDRPWMHDAAAKAAHAERINSNVAKAEALGRWPANLVHDGSEEVLAAFPDLGKSTGGRIANISKTSAIYGGGNGLGQNLDADAVRGDPGYGDSGSAARFFYTAKANLDDRLGSKHPTIKPVDLMQWLVRLVTPPGGLILDCFAGTGTTGEAAWREGMRAVLIEREAEYCEDIRRRMALLFSSSAERRRQAHKETQKRRPLDHQGTLFE